MCQSRVGSLDSLYINLLNSDIINVKIIAIGVSSDNSSNDMWVNKYSIPIVVDEYPYDTWNNWGAEQRDLFFLDSSGTYITNINISAWDYNEVYNQIINILP